MTRTPTLLPNPPEIPKLVGLDHLRALAITFVFFYHYRRFDHPGWVPRLGKFGWTGVDLFFVLSGFLIASQLFAHLAKGKQIDFKTFFLKRFFRIIPAYLVVVGIYFLVPAFRETEALPPLWKFLTFTQNFGMDTRHFSTFSHAWSLCIEEQFYLLLPLTLMALFYVKQLDKGFYLLLALFVMGLAIRMYNWHVLVAPHSGSTTFSPQWYRFIYYPTYARLDGLLAGVGLAGVFQFLPTLKDRWVKHGNWLIALSLLVLGLAYILCEKERTFLHTAFGFPTVALGYGILVLAAVSPTSILYRFRSKLTEKVAALSYAIYLTHKGLIHITQEYGAKLGLHTKGTLMVLMCMLVCVLGAYVLNILVEKPFLRLRDRVLKPAKHRQPAPFGLARQ